MDNTENVRRTMVTAINEIKSDRQILEERYGQVWDTDELTKDFVVVGFLAPFVVVERKSDNKKMSLMFQDYPRYYFQAKEAE